MNILVLNGSPRLQGTTRKMINAFNEGACNVGHQVHILDVCKMNISGCKACEYCHSTSKGKCIINDDMEKVYQHLNESELLVIASPIYYHGISGQLKCTLDRLYLGTYPKKKMKLKKVAMILSSGDDNMYDGAMFSYEGDFLGYLGLEDMGVFTSHGYQNGSKEKLEELRKFGESL